MKITLIGSGNVAAHLAMEFTRLGHQVVEVCGRNPDTTATLAHQAGARQNTSPELINQHSDLYVCALPDDAVAELIPVFAGLVPEQAMIVHTSGVLGLEVFPDNCVRGGVFYPLQTFTAGIPADLSDIPFLVQAQTPGHLDLLRRLAGSITSRVITDLSQAQKEYLHLAAVFANNFPNHLFSIARQLCLEHGLSFELLRPLMLQTVRNLDFMPPEEAQTGPAIRNDERTIRKHSVLLENHETWKEIYALLSRSIAGK